MHVWKETDLKSIETEIYFVSLSISSCFKRTSVISLYLMSALNDLFGIQSWAVSFDRDDWVKKPNVALNGVLSHFGQMT